MPDDKLNNRILQLNKRYFVQKNNLMFEYNCAYCLIMCKPYRVTKKQLIYTKTRETIRMIEFP